MQRLEKPNLTKHYCTIVSFKKMKMTDFCKSISLQLALTNLFAIYVIIDRFWYSSIKSVVLAIDTKITLFGAFQRFFPCDQIISLKREGRDWSNYTNNIYIYKFVSLSNTISRSVYLIVSFDVHQTQSCIFSCNTHVASGRSYIYRGILFHVKTWYSSRGRSFSFAGVCRFRSRIGTRDDTPYFRLAVGTRVKYFAHVLLTYIIFPSERCTTQ